MSFHPAQTFTFGEQPSATKWQYIWDNDYALADGTGITTGVLVARHFGAGEVGSPALATGVPVQMVSTNYSAVATGTTPIPLDDTLPQNTEGDQYMTQSITPKSTTNQLIIEAKVFISLGTANYHAIAGLFQDSTASALGGAATFLAVSTQIGEISIRHKMTAGTTSSTALKVRAGGQLSTTSTFNGISGGRMFGGATLSNIKITEYKA